MAMARIALLLALGLTGCFAASRADRSLRGVLAPVAALKREQMKNSTLPTRDMQVEVQRGRSMGGMVAEVLAVAHSAPLARGANTSANWTNKSRLPTPLLKVLIDLRTREHSVSESMQSIDMAEKRDQARLLASLQRLRRPAASGAGGDPISLAKTRATLKKIAKVARRKYSKERALKRAEIADLEAAEQGVEHHNIGALQRVMAKMQAEQKEFEAQSGDFLHFAQTNGDYLHDDEDDAPSGVKHF